MHLSIRRLSHNDSGQLVYNLFVYYTHTLLIKLLIVLSAKKNYCLFFFRKKYIKVIEKGSIFTNNI